MQHTTVSQLTGARKRTCKKTMVLLLLFEGSRVPRGSSEKKQAGEPYHFSLKMLRAYIQNCVSCVGGDDIFRKIMKKLCRKVKNGAEKPQMAHVNGICAGLVGPKSENVEKVLVLVLLLEGSRGPRGRQSREKSSGPDRPTSKKL